ncbi:MAG: Asp-tRNA(Asn)/Glu-tRNA(Gln) amidotransferase subunit GatC [Armatimonadota bacterium]
MPEIKREEVLHVANNLARLELSDDEVERLQYELGRIMEYFLELQKIDTRDVDITSHVLPMTNVLRDDQPGECLSQEDALSNAPDKIEGFFRVPRILEE